MKKSLFIVTIIMFMFLGGGYAFAASGGCCAKTSCICVKGGCCANGNCACQANCCAQGSCKCASGQCAAKCNCQKQ